MWLFILLLEFNTSSHLGSLGGKVAGFLRAKGLRGEHRKPIDNYNYNPH
jgi:hypothetical protein